MVSLLAVMIESVVPFAFPISFQQIVCLQAHLPPCLPTFIRSYRCASPISFIFACVSDVARQMSSQRETSPRLEHPRALPLGSLRRGAWVCTWQSRDARLERGKQGGQRGDGLVGRLREGQDRKHVGGTKGLGHTLIR